MVIKCVLFDWGGTVMREFPGAEGPMYLWQKVAAVRGVAEAICHAHRDKVIALATNSIASQESDIRRALDRVGLDIYFDKIYCFTKMGIMKPSPRFFEYIIAEMNVSPENLVMVGDDFEKDIKGANRCGIYGVWYNECSSEHKSNKMYDTIFSMTDLRDALVRREEMA